MIDWGREEAIRECLDLRMRLRELEAENVRLRELAAKRNDRICELLEDLLALRAARH
jgi:hypothetical protein